MKSYPSEMRKIFDSFNKVWQNYISEMIDPFIQQPTFLIGEKERSDVLEKKSFQF